MTPAVPNLLAAARPFVGCVVTIPQPDGSRPRQTRIVDVEVAPNVHTGQPEVWFWGRPA